MPCVALGMLFPRTDYLPDAIAAVAVCYAVSKMSIIDFKLGACVVGVGAGLATSAYVDNLKIINKALNTEIEDLIMDGSPGDQSPDIIQQPPVTTNIQRKTKMYGREQPIRTKFRAQTVILPAGCRLV